MEFVASGLAGGLDVLFQRVGAGRGNPGEPCAHAVPVVQGRVIADADAVRSREIIFKRDLVVRRGVFDEDRELPDMPGAHDEVAGGRIEAQLLDAAVVADGLPGHDFIRPGIHKTDLPGIHLVTGQHGVGICAAGMMIQRAELVRQVQG